MYTSLIKTYHISININDVFLIDAIKRKLLFCPSPLQKNKTRGLYIYTLRILQTRGLKSLFSITCIFLEHLFLKYYCTLSLKIYLVKHLKVFKYIKEDLLYVPATSYLGLPATLVKENESNF